MSDPFEVRRRFTYQLNSLGASTTAAQKAATYALRNKHQSEDLHSCIIESMEDASNSMNQKANIMYFLEPLCDMARREEHMEVIRMIQRDIPLIVDLVAPAAASANVKVVRKVLNNLNTKGFLESDTVKELSVCLDERDADPGRPTLSPIAGAQSTETSPTGIAFKPNGLGRVEKRQIEQRIEEDRERHKRLRENIWAVQPDKEFDQLWDDASDVGEDDFLAAHEDAAERSRMALLVD